VFVAVVVQYSGARENVLNSGTVLSAMCVGDCVTW